MSQSPFQKFVPKKKNSVVKEEFRQEKKKYRKERNAFFDKKKEEEYQARQAKKGGMASKAADHAKGKKQLVPIAIWTNEQLANENTKLRGAAKTPHTKSAKATAANDNTPTGIMPLNKYMAHCGVCSRRDAVELINTGKVKVNGTIATEPGYKVQETDEVIYNGKKLFVTKNLVYILLNKPKDYITTTDDPQGRKTVLQLIKHATTERVYPIGRLDRNTSGVLLLTNDGDLTQKLSHPSYEIKKIYEVKLDKPLTKGDFDKIIKGLKLEDGEILIDSLAYADSKDKSIIGIELHSGRNRIVRRIFEHLGYDVKGLDRVMYANLTKKNVERSKWRFLSEKEIRLLKYMNTSKKS
jgi:23S rRNA pseudouridine2605 synthase